MSALDDLDANLFPFERRIEEFEAMGYVECGVDYGDGEDFEETWEWIKDPGGNRIPCTDSFDGAENEAWHLLFKMIDDKEVKDE